MTRQHSVKEILIGLILESVIVGMYYGTYIAVLMFVPINDNISLPELFLTVIISLSVIFLPLLLILDILKGYKKLLANLKEVKWM